MDRLQVAVLTIGAWLVLLAGLAGLRALGKAVGRQDRRSGTAGLVPLAIFFIVMLVVVLILTRGDPAAAIPAPPTPAFPGSGQ